MMFESKMVCCLKANGKVLREHNDTVYVPFGTEYSILLKNQNTHRALVTITIDGKEVSSGHRLVVDAHSTFEIERFINSGNMLQGNKFKFIERTAGIEQYRGIGAEDGIVRVEFQYERPVPRYIAPTQHPWQTSPSPWYGPVTSQPRWDTYDRYFSTYSSTSSAVPLAGSPLRNVASGSYAANNVSVAKEIPTAAKTEVGITVPGAVSDQQFTQVRDFPVEDTKHVIVFRILGETPMGAPVTQTVTVKTKPKCTTCGRLNKAGSKFCVNCGTSLNVL